VRTFATRAVPDTVGDAEFVGANNAATATVDADHLVVEPVALVEVTATPTKRVTSELVNEYVAEVAPEMSEHTAGRAFAATVC
jgi:hypothetical protein